MRDYESWSFGDRSFVWALGLSLVWHAFWFFSLTITMNGPAKAPAKTKIISIGAVLDDSLFRTIVENRPQLSEAFYRAPSDFSEKLEPAAEMPQSPAQGDVVSVPWKGVLSGPLKGILGGEKFAPDFDVLEDIRKTHGELPEGEKPDCEEPRDEDCPDVKGS